MFSDPTFIAASRGLVCVRLESYESKEHQEKVRELLNGRFANTAFCVLAPDGETRLSSAGRSPSSLFGRRGGRFSGPPEEETENTIAKLRVILKDFAPRQDDSQAVVQDFHTFRQALNVASGDQRLLLLTVASQENRKALVPTLQKTLNEATMIGRYHHDFAEGKEDQNWAEQVEGEKAKNGYLIIRPDRFGLKGKVVTHLPLTANADELSAALTQANKDYAKNEERKVYRDHVREARRKGTYFENAVPYGEDRDGDGVIDPKRGRNRG